MDYPETRSFGKHETYHLLHVPGAFITRPLLHFSLNYVQMFPTLLNLSCRSTVLKNQCLLRGKAFLFPRYSQFFSQSVFSVRKMVFTSQVFHVSSFSVYKLPRLLDSETANSQPSDKDDHGEMDHLRLRSPLEVGRSQRSPGRRHVLAPNRAELGRSKPDFQIIFLLVVTMDYISQKV